MIEYVTAAIAVCKAGLATLKWTKEKYDTGSFSDAEKDILRAAAEQGTIQIVKAASLLTVFAGGTDFQGRDPARGARYLDAFMELCDKGLVTYHDDELFCLNSKGFEIARALPKWVPPTPEDEDE